MHLYALQALPSAHKGEWTTSEGGSRATQRDKVLLIGINVDAVQ